MTKYQETLRLSGLVLNQQNIADSYNVSKKTGNRVLKWAKELNISCHLMKAIPMLYLQKKSFLLQNKSHPTKMVIPGFSEPPFRRIRATYSGNSEPHLKALLHIFPLYCEYTPLV